MSRTLAFLVVVVASVSVACGNGDEVAERRLEVTEFMESIQWPHEYEINSRLDVTNPIRGLAQNQGGNATISFDAGDSSPAEIMAAFNSSITDAGFVVRSGEAVRCGTEGIRVFYGSRGTVTGGSNLSYEPEFDMISFQVGWHTIPTERSFEVGELPVCE